MTTTNDSEKERGEVKPKRRTRRRVLQVTGAVLASGGLAAGGYVLWGRRQRFSRDAQQTIRDHRVPWPATAPRMLIARGADPRRNLRGALERLGGLKQFVTPDDVVLIKPNIGWNRTPEQAANTHPWIVAELIRACRECRPKRVIVSDCPVSNSKLAFVRSGIMQVALAAGAEVLPPEDSRFVTVRISERLGTWDVLEPFVQATKIINVPVAKHHGETSVTGGMKNWIGITNKLRLLFHNDIDRSIAELAALMRPTLTIIDASRVLMRHGPQGGSTADVKQVNTVAACADQVAIDAWACSLLGIPDAKMPGYIHLGQKMGLGEIDYRRLSPTEITTG
jgi:uncharacterized protein (DUF362 family)